jgi:hypothetical protein
MTVNVATPLSGPFTADGVNREWAFSFKIFDDAHMRLLITDADGYSNPVIVDAGFSIAGNYLNEDTGGYVHYPIAPTDPVEAGKKVYTLRAVPYDQETKIGNQGGYYPKTHEYAFDYLSMQVQQISENVSRAVLVPVGSPLDAGDILADIEGFADSAALSAAAAEAAQDATESARDTTLAAIAALGGPLVFQGAWDASAGTFPGTVNRKKGWTYVVTVGGTVGGQLFEVNDRLVALVDNASTTVYAANWYRLEADLVQSVAGLTGTISAAALRSALGVLPSIDEDNMASNSDQYSPTQQSVKAYVDQASFVRPQAYGVVGDGVTNDAAAFQSCVTAAAGRPIWIGGLTIRIPTGNEIVVPGAGLNLQGRGKIVYEGAGTLFKAGTFTTTTYPFVATAGQTVFTAADSYTGAYVEVYQNGVLRPFWSNTITHNTTDITATFLNGGAALNDAVQIRVTRATASGLAAFSQVIVGAGVEIQTTQVNLGRAFQLAWPDTGYLPGRQYISFVMEQGAVIRGSDGNKGFTNAIWLHGAYNGRFSGDIYGVGANLIPAGGVLVDTLCQWGVYITGEWTTSDFRFYGGAIGFYCCSFGSLFSTVEGFMVTNTVFLNVGYMAYWEARTNDVGLYLDTKGVHVNAYHGIVWARQVSEVLTQGNLFFQGPGSTKPFFRYIELEGGSKEHVISDNVFRSFVNGANTIAVVARTGCRGLRGHNNSIVGSDATSVAAGFQAQSGSSDCVWGPNTYENVDQAAIVAAGSDRIGLLSAGDVFITPPGVTNPRYSIAGNHPYRDTPFAVISSSVAQSIANNTNNVVWTCALGANPQSIAALSSNKFTAPAWATKARVKARFTFAANVTGIRGIRLINDTLGSETLAKAECPAAQAARTCVSFDITIDVTAGHLFDIYAYQNSGGALNLDASELQVHFS